MGNNTVLGGQYRRFFQAVCIQELIQHEKMAKDNCRMVVIKRGMEVN